jgi:hypothetical protein
VRFWWAPREVKNAREFEGLMGALGRLTTLAQEAPRNSSDRVSVQPSGLEAERAGYTREQLFSSHVRSWSRSFSMNRARNFYRRSVDN